jgi:hypothetical protein
MSRPRFSYTPIAHEWVTLPIDVPNDQIQMICVLMEAYDNLCVVRTPKPGHNRVHVYVYEPQLPEVLRALRDIAADVPIQFHEPMVGMPGAIGYWETA